MPRERRSRVKSNYYWLPILLEKAGQKQDSSGLLRRGMLELNHLECLVLEFVVELTHCNKIDALFKPPADVLEGLL